MKGGRRVLKRTACAWLIMVWASSVGAQSPVQRPGVAPTHAADFGGIWISFDPASAQSRRGGALVMMRYRMLPPYKPEWEARAKLAWEKSRRGERIFDATSECIPPDLGMWYLFLYPTEIIMSPGQVTVNTEYFNQTRRFFTDGRKHPLPDDLDPTFLGHSVATWEGTTLVVDTTGIRGDLISELRPHSDQLRVVEQIRLVDDHHLEWEVTMTDPIAFSGPFNMKIALQRAPANDGIREYVCQESPNEETYADDAQSPNAAEPSL